MGDEWKNELIMKFKIQFNEPQWTQKYWASVQPENVFNPLEYVLFTQQTANEQWKHTWTPEAMLYSLFNLNH